MAGSHRRARADVPWVRVTRLGSAVVALLLVAGVADAAIPNADGRIYACYTSTGSVRLVGSASDCKAKETSISWSQNGAHLPMTLLISLESDGSGTVTNEADGTVCSTDCLLHEPTGTTVTLFPQDGPGSFFRGWEGACSGTGNCEVTLSSDMAVRAVFTKGSEPVLAGASGAGSLTSDPPGIDCPGDCMQIFPVGTEVTLTAHPDPGAALIGGFPGVQCIRAPANTCVVVADRTVITEARFDPVFELNWSQTIGGDVDVSPQPSFCDPPGDLHHCFYVKGTKVTLTARPDSGRTVIWSGDCTGSGSCQLVMSADHTVQANFPSAFTLTVQKPGDGSGTVTSSPDGIDCGSDCAELYVANTEVTLTAQADPGSHFVEWTDGCTGTSTQCTVTMGANKTALAWFAPDS